MTDDAAGLLAAELALGVLDGEERAVALRRVLSDRAFAADVDRWTRRFAALHAGAPEVDPGPAAAGRIDSIGRGVDRGKGWRPAAIIAAAAASVLLAILLVEPRGVPTPPGADDRPAVAAPRPILAAAIKRDGAEPTVALFDPARREIDVQRAPGVATERVAQLWAIGADGVPRSAGLLHRDGPTRIVIARTIHIAPGTTLAISIEPTGGSPKPTPTGPVVASGTLAVI